ncbi:MAG: hypothetical protein R2863_08965 [Candidatus Kapaibacterium sp.]|nr:hypothetical protein [Ignavibacteriota bacterium]
MNGLSDTTIENYKESEKVLRDLISINGIGLPMASTILRFRNPDVFPIIDKRAYRVLMDKERLSIYTSTNIDRQVEIYFEYIERVHKFSKDKKVKVCHVDRVLYIFDKEANKGIKI